MFIIIVRANKRIIINKTTISIRISGIVRWVNIDDINLAGMGVRKLGKRGEIVALDYQVIRGVGVVRNYGVDFFIVALDEYR